MFLAFALAGCDPAGTDARPPNAATKDAGDAKARSAPSAAPADRSARAPRRPPVLGGEPVERTVQAPVRAKDGRTREAARRRYGARLDEAPAPVLLPPAESPYFGGTLVVRPVFWAYSAANGPVSLAIEASTKARVYPEIRPKTPPDRVRGVPAWITENEGIVSISWIEHGIAYSLDVECADPRKALCQDEDLARSIANSLVPVGGKGVDP